MSGVQDKDKTTTGNTKGCDDISSAVASKMEAGNESSTSKDVKTLYYFKVEKVTEEDMKKVKKKKVEVNGETLSLISHDNKLFAIQEKCPHYGGPLHQGDIEDLPTEGPCIRCPWHSWKFSLLTGKCISPQRDDRRLKIYPVKVEKDSIKVGFDKIDDSIFSTPP